jgi:putative transposase
MNQYGADKMCAVLKVSSSGFYKWLTKKSSLLEAKSKKLIQLIQDEFEKSNQIYGSPRIAKKLKEKNHNVSRSYIARIMKRLNIRSKTRKKFKVTTDSSHSYQIAPNLLNRDFTATDVSQKWVSDLTYIRTKAGWLYLTTVIDLADRKVIGWAFSKSMTAKETSVKALKMAIKCRGVKPGLIFHSDRGVQYACDEFKKIINKNEIHQSMSRKGNCWDNSVAESFFKTLKTELVYHYKFENREIAKLKIFEYIEGFYNDKRIHSAIGDLTPNLMEKYLNQNRRMVA